MLIDSFKQCVVAKKREMRMRPRP